MSSLYEKALKKWLAILLAFCMIFAMTPFTAMETHAAAMAGSGTADDPYQITTAEDLKAISASGYYKLMNDIVLTGEWTPISSFSGTLDGNGKKISGMKISSTNRRNGFILTLASGGTVKDLTLYGSVTCLATGNCGTEGTGGIVGYNNGTITGCEFHGTVSQKQGDNMCVAGIAGYNAGLISNCKNYGNITGISTGGSYNAVYIGGITGSNHGTVKISGCTNYGTVSGAVPNTNTNVGDIWGSDTWKSNGAYVGGIGGDTNNSSAPGCSNEGTVVGENTNAEAVTLTGVKQPSDITLTNPISDNELLTRLPSSVVLTTTDGNRVGTVVWDTSSYEPSKENAEYTFSSEVTLPSKVTNSNNIPLTVTITVTVGGGNITPTEPVDYALYFKDGKLYKATVDSDGDITRGDEYAQQTDRWSAEGNTLTLKGFEFETAASRALIMSDGTTLSLQKDTESTLNSTGTLGGGIYGEGGFDISGPGTVKASGTYGIVTSDLVIESGTVYATGTGESSVGLCGKASSGEHSGIIKGGKVIASGEMYGIYGYGDDLYIEGGEIWATGNNDNYGALFIYNGTLTNSDDVVVSVKGSTQYQAETMSDAAIHSEGGYCSVQTEGTVCKTIYIKTAPVHKHCVCGGTTDAGDHTAHSDVTYQPLSEFTGDTLPAGNYYLVQDTTLDQRVTINGNVNLCLNGYDLNIGDNSLWINSDSAEFNITDCVGTGSVQGSGSYIIYNINGKTSIYNAAIETTGAYGVNITSGEMNLYSGSIKAKLGGISANDVVLNIYGGEITAQINGVYADGTEVNITGGTIHATNPGASDVRLRKEGTILNLGGSPSISKIEFVDQNQISAKCGGQDYTGGPILLYNSSVKADDVIVLNVTKDVNDKCFSLDSEAYYLKLDGTDLIAAAVKHPVTLTGGTGYTLEAADGSTSPVTHDSSFKFQFTLSDGYSKTDNFAVKVNGTEVSLENDGSYTISKVTADTTVTVEGVADITAPTGEITVGTNKWHEFLNSITFGKFFSDTQKVEITGNDKGSGIEGIFYYISNAEMTKGDVQAVTDWKEYTDSFNIEPNDEYVIYAKITDNAGNIAYISSDGMVLDNIAPVISGIENGKTYCGAQTFTVAEKNPDKVMVNGTEISAVEGKYTILPAAGEQTVTVSDKAGNSIIYKVTINDGHTLQYSLKDDPSVIRQYCSVCQKESFAHITASDAVYAGTPAETAEVEYSDGWLAGELEITYKNNDGAGQATASITKGGVTAEASFNISKGAQNTPTVGKTDETVDGKADGVITGVDDTMEYRKDDETGYTPVADGADKITGLADGKYYVRYAENENYKASSDTEVRVEKGRKLVVTFEADGVTVDTKEVVYNGSLAEEDLPAIPAKAGYDRTPPTWDKAVNKLTEDMTVRAVYTVNRYTVPLNPGTGYTLEAVSDNTVNHGSSFTFKVTVSDGYSKTDDFKVCYNGDELTPNHDGSYTVTVVTDLVSPEAFGVEDITPPIGEITVKTNKWNSFMNTVTFGHFFSDTQKVEINGNDKGSGIEGIYYYISNAEMTKDDVQAVTDWNEYTDSFNIEPNDEYVIYAKITDNAGNITYISSNGMVLDNIAPVISGIENGKIYCGAVKFTVDEKYLDSVSLNGTVLTAEDGKFTVKPANGQQTIIASDKAGNTVKIAITVNNGHAWDEGEVTKEAAVGIKGERTFTCSVCGEKKTEEFAALKADKTENNKAVKTGDDFSLTIFIALALISLLCIAGVKFLRKQHE